MPPRITVSPSALQYLKEKIVKAKACGLRLSIKKTGCSGFSYVPTLAKTVNPKDVLANCESLPVFIDAAWVHFFSELLIDYEEQKTGLRQKKLMFVNPQESGRCGCGESFHIEGPEGAINV